MHQDGEDDSDKDNITILVRSRSTAVGQKFDSDYLKITVDRYDDVSEFRQKLFYRLHGLYDVKEHEYSMKTPINVMGQDALQLHKIGVMKASDNDTTIDDWVANITKEMKSFGCHKFFLQMPVNTRGVGGGTKKARSADKAPGNPVPQMNDPPIIAQAFNAPFPPNLLQFLVELPRDRLDAMEKAVKNQKNYDRILNTFVAEIPITSQLEAGFSYSH